MIREALCEINDSMATGFDKLYGLLELREKTVEYEDSGQFAAVPFDQYGRGGYWRKRSAVTLREERSNVACEKRVIITVPTLFVMWYNRSGVEETADELAEQVIDHIHRYRTIDLKTSVRKYDTSYSAQKNETGKTSQTYSTIIFEVDFIYTKTCDASCIVSIPTVCPELCDLIEEVTWQVIKECMDEVQIHAAIADICEAGPCPDTTISIPQAPSTTNQPCGETLTFLVKDEAGVDFANSLITGVSVDGQQYSILLQNTSLYLDGATQGNFSRRFDLRIFLTDPDGNTVPATLTLQDENELTFELDWVVVGVRDVSSTIYSESFINGQGVTLAVTNSEGAAIAAIMAGTQIRVSDGSLTIGGVDFGGLLAGGNKVLTAKDSQGNDITVEVGGDGGVVVPGLPCLVGGLPQSSPPRRDWDSANQPTRANLGMTSADWFNLDIANNPNLANHYPWPSNGYKRFTGKAGGYYDEVADTFHLSDGTATTKANAFPDDVVLDWSMANWQKGYVAMFIFRDGSNLAWGAADTYANYLAAIEAATIAGEGGWTVPTIETLEIISKDTGSNALNYQPFNWTGAGSLVSCTHYGGSQFRSLSLVTSAITTINWETGDRDTIAFKWKLISEL